MDWLDFLAVQGTLKSLLKHHSLKASILQHSAFFIVQLLHPYMTIGKTIDLTIRTFVGKVMSLLFNMLSRLVIAFIPRSKCLLISWCFIKCPHLRFVWLDRNYGLHNSMRLWATLCRATQDRWSWWRVLTKHPVEKGTATHSSILATRPAWTVWKSKRIWQWKFSP